MRSHVKRTRGAVYSVRSQVEEDQLAAYETDMYRVNGCIVHFADRSRAAGVTFVCNGGVSLLKEGTFCLKDWVIKNKEKFSIPG